MNNQDMSVAKFIAKFIAEKQSPAVFQLSGGMIAFLTDAIDSLGVTPLIHNRHEQASGFGAEGATRVHGKPAIAMGTSGPGATNLLTPISSCFFDSTPAIFLTGQVRTDEIKEDEKLRQNGFQELDICLMAKSITKATFKIWNASEVPNVLHEAWEIANSGRKGPVLIDIPIDVQQQIISPPSEVELEAPKTSLTMDEGILREIEAMLVNSKKPLAIIGGGVRLDGSVNECRNFLRRYKIPHVSTLMGLDSIDHTDPSYMGYIGSYGNKWANQALRDSDLLLVLGSRLDVRQIGPKPQAILSKKKIIRIDVDESELESRVSADVKLLCHLKEFFKIANFPELNVKSDDFTHAIKSAKDNNPQFKEQGNITGLNPTLLLEEISKVFSDSNGYIVDVGQHQMWAAQSLNLLPHQRFLTSGGLGAMGFAVPAAIGAAVACKGRWVVIVGDGCIQLSLQELQTISQLNLPITICIINNNQHGMVAQFQEENMGGRYVGTRQGFSNPDYRQLSRGFGIEKYYLIKSMDEFEKIRPSLQANLNLPEILEFSIDNAMKALPKMSFKTD